MDGACAGRNATCVNQDCGGLQKVSRIQVAVKVLCCPPVDREGVLVLWPGDLSRPVA